MFGVWLLILTPNENKEIKTKLKKTTKNLNTNTSLSHTPTKYVYLFNKWKLTCNSSEPWHFIHPFFGHWASSDTCPTWSVRAQHPPLVLQTHLSPLPGTFPFPATGLGFLTGTTAGSPGSKEAWRATPAAPHSQNTSSTPTRKGRDKNPCA